MQSGRVKYVGLGIILVVLILIVVVLRMVPGNILSLIFQGSVDTSDINTQYLDVPYGTASASQTMNIYLPNDGDGPYPLIVVIHGGGFMSGNATSSDLSAMFDGLNRGYAVASVNYRLSSEATFPAAVSDVRAAVRFLKANAEQYQIDPTKIAVWGPSAGGNLAAMVGTTSNVDTLNGDNLENLDYSSNVQAVVDWFGPIEFLAMDAQFEILAIEPALGVTDRENSPESRYIGQIISADPELTQQANPAAYITTLDVESAPRFFIQHGTADANVPVLQSENFANALTVALGPDNVTYNVIEGAGHGTEEFYTEANLDLVFAFIDDALKVNQ